MFVASCGERPRRREKLNVLSQCFFSGTRRRPTTRDPAFHDSEIVKGFCGRDDLKNAKNRARKNTEDDNPCRQTRSVK